MGLVHTDRGKHGNNELNHNELKKKPLYCLNPALSYFHTKEMKTFNKKNCIHVNLHHILSVMNDNNAIISGIHNYI